MTARSSYRRSPAPTSQKLTEGVGSEGCTPVEDSRSEASPGAQRPGLVHSQTSGTRISEEHVLAIDPLLKRQKRCRYATLTAARLLQQEAERGGHRVQPWMVTLTYRPGCHWKPRDISIAKKAVQRYLKRAGIRSSNVWKAELQKRGEVHYHLIYWLPKGRTMPKWDKQGWWKHGMTQVVKARNAVGYIAKYLSKEEEGQMPKGCRTYGCGGMTQAGRQIAAWWKLPTFVRDSWGSEHRAKRIPGGQWVSRLTGEVLESEWGFAGFSRGCVLLRRRKPGERAAQAWSVAERCRERVESYGEDIYEQGKAVQARFQRLADDQLGWLRLADTVIEGRF